MKKGAIERAFEDFQRGKIKRTGVMIHYVIQQVDRGEPIVTQEVEIRPEDSLQDLEVSNSFPSYFRPFLQLFVETIPAEDSRRAVSCEPTFSKRKV